MKCPLCTLIRRVKTCLKKSDEMKKWEGGKMPVVLGTIVEVEHRDGSIFTSPAGYDFAEDWSHDPDNPEIGDIVAYRVVPRI